MMNYGKNMLLHTSYWGDKDTFKMLPVTQDCPYAEVIYDPTTTLLVIISKISKENLQFVPKVNEQGDMVPVKRPRANGKNYCESRISMQLLQEYYLTTKEEQESFIEQFAINADSYDYKKFLRDLEEEARNPIKPVEQKPLVDINGNKL
jgi:hypothetical protein